MRVRCNVPVSSLTLQVSQVTPNLGFRILASAFSAIGVDMIWLGYNMT